MAKAKGLSVVQGNFTYTLFYIGHKEYVIHTREKYKRGNLPIRFLAHGHKLLDRDLAAKHEFINFLRLRGVSIPPNFKTWRLI